CFELRAVGKLQNRVYKDARSISEDVREIVAQNSNFVACVEGEGREQDAGSLDFKIDHADCESPRSLLREGRRSRGKFDPVNASWVGRIAYMPTKFLRMRRTGRCQWQNS